ncbi:hypothetical protein F5Y10DRAFT_272147 [Nemania abortiva]|nr:hypothetical protein F5Y10DRAFT_272147 [Nemania abortiva]
MSEPEQLKTWQNKVAWARAYRDASLAKVEPKLQGLPDELPVNCQSLPKAVLTPREIEITENYTITELLAAMRDRDISVLEITRPFCDERLWHMLPYVSAQLEAEVLVITNYPQTNCLTELMWDQAIARAQYLDSLPEPRRELFGLPISTKEQHGMVGPNV